MAYSWEKRNYKKWALIGLIFGIVLNILMMVGEVFLYKYWGKTVTSQVSEFNGVTYNETTNTSSFNLKVKFTNNSGSIGKTATSTTYVLAFKDKNGTILGEKTLVMEDDIGIKITTIDVSFGDGMQYPAVEGKISTVTATTIDVVYENSAKLTGASNPLEFMIKKWIFPLFILISLALFTLSFVIMEWDPPAIVSIIGEWGFMIVGVFLGCIGSIAIISSFFI